MPPGCGLSLPAEDLQGLAKQDNGYLSIDVCQAKNLKDFEAFGKMDVYTKITLGSSAAPEGATLARHTVLEKHKIYKLLCCWGIRNRIVFEVEKDVDHGLL